jgi:N-dimethylarginine dimethylaminohydrolase
VFVGIGERTDPAGAAALQAILGAGYAVHVLQLAPRILHLDVVLNLLPGNLVLIYPSGLRDVPDRLRRAYELVEVTADEQDRLATNVLSLDERTVVADERHERVASILANRGLDVRMLPFAETTKIGGSFRCSTLPLVRG